MDTTLGELGPSPNPARAGVLLNLVVTVCGAEERLVHPASSGIWLPGPGSSKGNGLPREQAEPHWRLSPLWLELRSTSCQVSEGKTFQEMGWKLPCLPHLERRARACGC